MQVRKAIIPCAGLGTRFLPATKVLPKELLPIVDTPALSYIVDEAVQSGIEEIMIVISPNKDYIKKLFEPNVALNERLLETGDKKTYELANKACNARISFVVQETMNGNGNAVKLCKEFVGDEPVAVLFGDDVMYAEGVPVTKQLIDAYSRTEACIVGCQQTDEQTARRCGVMIANKAIDDKLTEISGIVEKPKRELPSNLVSLGRYILTPDIFDAIERTPAVNGEVYLTEAISLLAKQRRVCACLFEARRYDIGNKEGFLEATVEFALRDENLKKEFKAYLDGLR